jgi:hypothetical protein
MAGELYDVRADLEGLTPMSWSDIRSVASGTFAQHTVRDQGGKLRATYAGMQACVRVILMAAPMSYSDKAEIAKEWCIDTNAYMGVLAEMWGE